MKRRLLSAAALFALTGCASFPTSSARPYAHCTYNCTSQWTDPHYASDPAERYGWSKSRFMNGIEGHTMPGKGGLMKVRVAVKF